MSLSFQDELTFSPKLNSLSLKLAGVNRTSILKRIAKADNPVLESSCTLTSLSTNNSKIVNKLKTKIFEGRRLHHKQKKNKLNQRQSIIHLKGTENEKNDEIIKKLVQSVSDQTCQNIQQLSNEKTNPCSKSFEIIYTDKERSRQLEYEKYENISGKYIRIKRNPYVTSSITGKSTSVTSLDPSQSNQFYSTDKSLHYLTTTEKQESISNITVSLETRIGKNHQNIYPDSYTLLTSKLRTDKMDMEHQKLIHIKKIASQVIKNKKVFACNGPYYPLRAALRNRGWVEKCFKGNIGFTFGGECEKPYNHCKQQQQYNQQHSKHRQQQQQQHNQDQNTNSNVMSRFADALSSCSDAKHVTQIDKLCFDKPFSCDKQYGIMSRIVRNTMPTFIWTLKRDDVEFRLLHKEQIVNHYSCAWKFTTKTGLCTHLKKIVAFEAKNWQTFFPRCYRLCCNEEKEEFVDDYRLTTIQCIMKVVINNYQQWCTLEKQQVDALKEKQKNCNADYRAIVSPKDPTTIEDNLNGEQIPQTESSIILPDSTLSLVLKKGYFYLDMWNNRDIEETYKSPDEPTQDSEWSIIIKCYNQIMTQNAIISKAWQYANECRDVLKEMETFCPQMRTDGHSNLWILKPGAKSRGRGIEIMNQLEDILQLVNGNVSQKENRWVIQKYIERPLLIYRTKFDIRQWFLVTDWNPLMLWFYEDCYIRFCSEEFTLTKFDPQIHLSNNSVQKNYENGAARSEHLPESNMWSSETFKEYLAKIGKGRCWDERIYPGMKSAIISALQSCQNDLEYRKNSFELYGADFMLCEELNPWLIEINSSPALGASTPVTQVLCRNVFQDTLKVVLDRRENKNCDTGRFVLAYRQPYIPIPCYLGCNLLVEGSTIKPPPSFTHKKKVKETNEGSRAEIVPSSKRNEIQKMRVETQKELIETQKEFVETVTSPKIQRNECQSSQSVETISSVNVKKKLKINIPIENATANTTKPKISLPKFVYARSEKKLKMRLDNIVPKFNSSKIDGNNLNQSNNITNSNSEDTSSINSNADTFNEENVETEHTIISESIIKKQKSNYCSNLKRYHNVPASCRDTSTLNKDNKHDKLESEFPHKLLYSRSFVFDKSAPLETHRCFRTDSYDLRRGSLFENSEEEQQKPSQQICSSSKVLSKRQGTKISKQCKRWFKHKSAVVNPLKASFPINQRRSGKDVNKLQRKPTTNTTILDRTLNGRHTCNVDTYHKQTNL